MKKTIAIIVAAIMLISCLSVAAVNAATTATIKVNGTEYTANVGDTVTYTVNMTTPEKIENGQFLINYTESALTVEGVEFDPILGSPTYNYNQGISDSIYLNFSSTDGYDFTTKHMLIKVTFKVKAASNAVIMINKDPEEFVISDLNDKDVQDKAVFEEIVTGATKVTPSTPAVTKKANTIKVTAANKSVKASKLKKKAQTVKKALKVTKAQGKVTYKKVKGGSTAKLYKKVTVNSKTGAIKIKKGKLAKKTYKLVISVTAAGNKSYKAKTVKKTVKIKVK